MDRQGSKGKNILLKNNKKCGVVPPGQGVAATERGRIWTHLEVAGDAVHCGAVMQDADRLHEGSILHNAARLLAVLRAGSQARSALLRV